MARARSIRASWRSHGEVDEQPCGVLAEPGHDLSLAVQDRDLPEDSDLDLVGRIHCRRSAVFAVV